MIYKRGWWCAWCESTFKRGAEGEKVAYWIPCDYCHRFTHHQCEEENECRALSGETYACPTCREKDTTPKTVPSRAEVKLSKGTEVKKVGRRRVYSRPFDNDSSAMRAAEKRVNTGKRARNDSNTRQGKNIKNKRHFRSSGKSGKSENSAKSGSSARQVSKSGPAAWLSTLAHAATRELPTRATRRYAPKQQTEEQEKHEQYEKGEESEDERAQQDEEKEKQQMQVEKEQTTSEVSLRRSSRPRPSKDLAKLSGRDEPEDETRTHPCSQIAEKGARRSRSGRSRSGVRKSKPLFDSQQMSDVLFPFETGGMVGPLSQLGSLLDLHEPQNVPAAPLLTHNRVPAAPILTLKKPQKQRPSSKKQRPPSQPIARTRPLSVSTTQQRASYESELESLESIANRLYESLDPSFDQHTIYLNVCRLLHDLACTHGTAARESIIKTGLNDVVGALLVSDDVRVRLAADGLLKIPSWREAICGRPTPQRANPTGFFPTMSMFSGLASGMPSMLGGFASAAPTPTSHVVGKPVPMRPRCPRDAQEARNARTITLGMSQSSPTETITPDASQPAAIWPNFPMTSQDAEAEAALLFSASQDQAK
ncbi:Zinc finger, PHD-type, conserved site [Ostreococcus tauri]|uniref:Zinc finger, PHD-type, conserved site n=1 Tax=Ostreococcus tauri TaxID=70448 RepID=A0A090M4Y3_OSTTA|nr:Zinc finger, PHD-type, conserved site [Ostreococcus tauri]CEF97189.1 Zinc finger, PHD-type, conserved site [Ostreococcus tauri]|eukprot:XP_022838535.1 Zinc finger, PHD-type, conserved site [Ostreococcus tauri]